MFYHVFRIVFYMVIICSFIFSSFPNLVMGRDEIEAEDTCIIMAIVSIMKMDRLPNEFNLIRTPDAGKIFLVAKLKIKEIKCSYIFLKSLELSDSLTLFDINSNAYKIMNWNVEGLEFENPNDITSRTAFVPGSIITSAFEIPLTSTPSYIQYTYDYGFSWSDYNTSYRNIIDIELFSSQPPTPVLIKTDGTPILGRLEDLNDVNVFNFFADNANKYTIDIGMPDGNFYPTVGISLETGEISTRNFTYLDEDNRRVYTFIPKYSGNYILTINESNSLLPKDYSIAIRANRLAGICQPCQTNLDCISDNCGTVISGGSGSLCIPTGESSYTCSTDSSSGGGCFIHTVDLKNRFSKNENLVVRKK
jgi:hypothetical protein